MSRKQSAEPSSFKVQGFIEVEKISQGGKVKETYKCNTITPVGKQTILARSMGLALTLGTNGYGDLYTSDPNDIRYNDIKLIRDDQVLTNTLLNLSASELSGLGANSRSVKVWNDTFTAIDKVVGFANVNINPYVVGKEGKVDFCKASYMTDNKVICKRWYYPQGVATGTINTIAMMPASQLKYKAGQGLRVSRFLDRVNSQGPNFGHYTTAFCPPGIPGFTSNQEILLNYEQNNVSKHKFNFVTGEMTDITDENTPFFCPCESGYRNELVDMYYDSSKSVLYILQYNDYDSRAYISSWKFNGDGTYTQLNARNRNINSNYGLCKFFVDSNNDLCVSNGSSGDASIYKCTRDSNGEITSISSSGSLSDLITIPSGLSDYMIALGMYNGNYVLYIKNKLMESIRSSSTVDDRAKLGNTGYVFSSLSSGLSSLVDIITNVDNCMVPFKAGTYVGFLELGFNQDGSYSYDNGIKNYANIFPALQNADATSNTSPQNTSSGSSSYNTGKYYSGLWYTPDGAWGNMMSFAKLDTAITKGDTDELYVSYGYQIL